MRTEATLRVGQASRRCKRGRSPKCVIRITTAPTLAFGQKTTLDGELRIGGKAAAGRVEVFRRLKMAAAEWEHFGSIQASAAGRVRYEVPARMAQLLRFRYAGSPTARGATEVVDARVRAASTFKPSRQHVVNGEYITFRGRLKGGLIPPGGKLVELQVFTRRRWRTFAQPRSSAAGRWSFQ